MLIWKNRRGSNRSYEDVKRRSRFESRRFRRYEADEAESDVELPDNMKDKQSYTDFVKHLSSNVTDPKAKAWIDYAFGGKSEDVQFKAEAEKAFPVKDLKPTQNFIGLENSIGWTVNNPDKAGAGLKKMLLESSPEMKPGSAIWIFNGKFIIDGHHRWSQVYAFNPDAKIVAVNFTCNTSLKPQQALAAVQGVIASVVGNVPIATSKVDGKDIKASNVLKDSEDTMLKAAQTCLDSSAKKNDFVSLCESIVESKNAEDREISSIRSGFNNDNSDAAKVLTFAVRNCLKLKSGNNAVDGAPDREYMPQTDGGKGASKDTPNKVMTSLQTGVDDVVKQVERRGIPRAIHKKYID